MTPAQRRALVTSRLGYTPRPRRIALPLWASVAATSTATLTTNHPTTAVPLALAGLTLFLWGAYNYAVATDPTLPICGSCSDSLDDWAEWAEIEELPLSDRIPCRSCGTIGTH